MALDESALPELLNQAIFERFYLDEGATDTVIKPPFAELVAISEHRLAETATLCGRRALHSKTTGRD